MTRSRGTEARSRRHRGTVVLQRLQERTEGFPSRPATGSRYIGFADDIDFTYILDGILDHAETLMAA